MNLNCLTLVVSALLATVPGEAADAWLVVEGAHSRVLTNGTADQARATAARVDSAHRILSHAWPDPGLVAPFGAPVVVLALRDGASFDPLRPRRGGQPVQIDGFVQGGSDTAYVVFNLGSQRDDVYETAAHEYTHVYLSRVLPAQPTWVSEGLAELFGSFVAAPTRVVVGQPVPRRVAMLRRGPLLDAAELLGVDGGSPTYLDPARNGLFYAQSWALVRSLLLQPSGRPRLLAFLNAVASGRPAEAAFSDGFGGTPAAAQARALAELETDPAPMVLDLTPARTDREVGAAARSEIEWRIADLLIGQGRTAEARDHATRAVEGDPASAPAQALAAQVAIRQARWPDAQRHLEAVRAAQGDDPAGLFGYALSIVQQRGPGGELPDDASTAKAVEALTRAVALSPTYADAVDLLARLAPKPAAERIRQLEAAFAANPQRADLVLTLASIHLGRNDMAAAGRALSLARAASRDETQKFIADHVLGRIRGHGQQELEGTLVQVDCPDDGSLAFRVRDRAGRVHRFVASSPTALFLYGPDGEPSTRTFSCAAQSVAVKARFQRARVPADADGVLLSLTFQG